MSEPIYRPAVLSDLHALCVLGREVNLLHHEAWPDIFAPSAEPERDAAHWCKGLQGEGATTFVAEIAASVVGFITIQLADETHSMLQPIRFARVGSVCVTQAERGKGIGSKLMELAEAWATSLGASEMRLNVWQFNASAIRLYEELGYAVRSLNMSKSFIK